MSKDYMEGYTKYYENYEFRIEVLMKDMDGQLEKYLISIGNEEFKDGVLKAREEITAKYLKDLNEKFNIVEIK